MEGLELSVCPRYGQAPKPREAIAAETSPPGVGLPLADALDIEGAERVLKVAGSRVIAIIGPNDAGKTSLLAGVYDRFQTDSVGNLLFSRSRTFQSFELVCHDARAESRRGVPHSERTNRGEVKFYHLEVFDGSQLTELVIADRSGEEYRDASSDVEQIAGLPELGRSDRLTILVDGSQFADAGGRHNARASTLMILQSLIDGGAVEKTKQSLAVVLTKLDTVLASEDALKVKSDFNKLVADIQRRFGNHFLDIAPFEVAASPKSTDAVRGAGLDDLIKYWAGPIPSPTKIVPPVYKNPRTFGRLRIDETRK